MKRQGCAASSLIKHSPRWRIKSGSSYLTAMTAITAETHESASSLRKKKSGSDWVSDVHKLLIPWQASAPGKNLWNPRSIQYQCLLLFAGLVLKS
jgi:hypothetical protein